MLSGRICVSACARICACTLSCSLRLHLMCCIAMPAIAHLQPRAFLGALCCSKHSPGMLQDELWLVTEYCERGALHAAWPNHARFRQQKEAAVLFSRSRRPSRIHTHCLIAPEAHGKYQQWCSQIVICSCIVKQSILPTGGHCPGHMLPLGIVSCFQHQAVCGWYR